MPDDRRRDVVVPLRLYKTVTVFSTLIAAGCVVAGFLVIDVATDAGRAAPPAVDAPLALVGVGLIAAGAAVFAYGTRFRAPGMRKAKDDTDEPSGDG
ncbi:MAG: hypothetical protein ABEJ92_03830 [Halobacteriales archaeon]